MARNRGSKRKLSQKSRINSLIENNMGLIDIEPGLKQAIIQADKALEEFSLEQYTSMIDMVKQSLSPQQLDLAKVKQSLRKLNKTAQDMSRTLQRPITSRSRPHRSSSVRTSVRPRRSKEEIHDETRLLINEIYSAIEEGVATGKKVGGIILRNKQKIISNFSSMYPKTEKNYTLIRTRIEGIINDKIKLEKLARSIKHSSGQKKKSKGKRKKRKTHKLKK